MSVFVIFFKASFTVTQFHEKRKQLQMLLSLFFSILNLCELHSFAKIMVTFFQF